MITRQHGLTWLCLSALVLGGCDPEYPLPPTACDDYCHAVQRGNCEDDAPADCVRDCESAGSAAAPASCDAAWRARNACFLTAAASVFVCEDKHSKLPDICLDERRALTDCLAPGSSVCFDECLRQVEACGANLLDCETACAHPNPACADALVSYDTCLLDYPVECRGWLEADPRSPDEIPCINEALAVLACGK